MTRVTKAIERTLKLYPDLKATIKRGEGLNADPQLCPWVGIYIGDSDHEAAFLAGGDRPWRVIAEVELYLQHTSPESGEQAQDRVQALAKTIREALQANISLNDESGRAVCFIRNITETPGYALGATPDNYYFRTLVITVTMEARA